MRSQYLANRTKGIGKYRIITTRCLNVYAWCHFICHHFIGVKFLHLRPILRPVSLRLPSINLPKYAREHFRGMCCLDKYPVNVFRISTKIAYLSHTRYFPMKLATISAGTCQDCLLWRRFRQDHFPEGPTYRKPRGALSFARIVAGTGSGVSIRARRVASVFYDVFDLGNSTHLLSFNMNS